MELTDNITSKKHFTINQKQLVYNEELELSAIIAVLWEIHKEGSV